MQPTSVQQKVLDQIFSLPLNVNVLVSAVAGAGKTTLLAFLAEYYTNQGFNFTAVTYSSTLAEDIERRITTATVSTTHARLLEACKEYLKIHNIRPQAIRQDDGTVKHTYVDKNLLSKTTNQYLKQSFGIAATVPTDFAKEFYSTQFSLIRLVELIRQKALSESAAIHTEFDGKFPIELVNDAVNVLQLLSERFFKRATVDFTGMLYLPITHPEIQRYVNSPDILAVDEVNDSNPLLRKAYALIGKDSKKVILVGDRKQTIHIWNGTESNCMDLLSSFYSAQGLEYEYTFRVPHKMCELLNNSGIDTRIKPYKNNKIGTVETIKYVNFFSMVKAGDVVLCRYNYGKKVQRTLESVSIELLSRGKKVALLGSSYIEDIKLILSFVSTPNAYDFRTKLGARVTNEVLNVISEEYASKDLKEDNYRCKELRRQLEVFNLYYKFYCSTLFTPSNTGKFIAFLEKMYDNSDSAIQLCSIHRSKGKEWKRVFVLHPEALCNDVTNESLTMEQRIEAHNLIVVACTRSLDETFFIDTGLPSFLPPPNES